MQAVKLNRGAASVIKVLVVDDSGFMRLALKKMLQNDESVQIVGEAANGDEAVKLAKRYKPDVITMDVEMPGLDGLQATKQIMDEAPTPIIMVSSLTKFAAATTMQALDIGAVDYIPKSSSFVDLDIVAIEKELLGKIRYWGARKLNVAFGQAQRPASGVEVTKQPATPLSGLTPQDEPDLITIGASTGGPKILPQLFEYLDPKCCPIVIALHMPPLYTESFASHLAKSSGHKAMEGYNGMPLEAGTVVIAPGGRDSLVEKNKDGSLCLRVIDDAGYLIHPSVDALFLSASKVAASPLGVILTGMGNDGTEGAREYSTRGFPVLAQDENSCLVYGMPKSVVDAGYASDLLDVKSIASRLERWAK